MQDPFNSGVAIGKIILTDPAVDRHQIIAGEHLPIENTNG
jgi:hypothetical protein